jgi:hypothetical protein
MSPKRRQHQIPEGTKVERTAIRLPAEMLDWVRDQADAEGISLNAMLVRIIGEYQQQRKEEKRHPS